MHIVKAKTETFCEIQDTAVCAVTPCNFVDKKRFPFVVHSVASLNVTVECVAALFPIREVPGSSRVVAPLDPENSFFNGFSHPLLENTGLVPQIMPIPFPSKDFTVHYSLISHDAV